MENIRFGYNNITDNEIEEMMKEMKIGHLLSKKIIMKKKKM